MASFDGGSSGGGGTDDLPLEHSVFTIDDSAPWGSDRRNGVHQPGGSLTQQQEQHRQDGSQAGGSGASPAGPVGTTCIE